MKFDKIISLVSSLIIPSLLYTYYYPWIYNKINSYTGRGEDLDDKMDILNVILVFIVTWILISLFILIFIFSIFFKKFKYKK